MKSSSRIQHSASHADVATSLLAAGWCIALTTMLIAGYYRIGLTEGLVFNLSDGWCVNPFRDGIGFHCFGDFGHPYYKGNFSQVYVPDNLVSVNSPLVMLFFQFLNLFTYRVGLALYIGLGIISCLAPALWASKVFDLHHEPLIVFFCCLGTTGFISSLDRANPVIFFPGLILLYLNALRKHQWTRAVLMVTFMSALKFWAPLLIIPLVALRRWRETVLSGILTVCSYILPMTAFPGSTVTNLKTMMSNVLSTSNTNLFQPYAISIGSLLRRIWCAIDVKGTCSTTTQDWGILDSRFFSIGIAFALVLVVYLVARLVGDNDFLLLVGPTLALCVVVIPTAQIYNTVLLLPLLALVFRDYNSVSPLRGISFAYGRLGWLSQRVVVVATAASSVPIVVVYFGDSMFSSNNGAGSVFRLVYWLIPSLWAIAFSVLCVFVCGQMRANKA